MPMTTSTPTLALLAELKDWHTSQLSLNAALSTPLLDVLSVRLPSWESAITAPLCAENARLTAETSRLSAENAHLAALVADLQRSSAAAEEDRKHEVAALGQRLAQLEKSLFGQSRERQVRTPDPNRELRKRNQLTPEERAERRRKADEKRRRAREKLRTEYALLKSDMDLTGFEHLPDGGLAKYEWRPGELFRIRFVTSPDEVPVGVDLVDPGPLDVGEGSWFGPRLHASVVVEKIVNGVPLRAQERSFQRRGAPLSASLLCAMYHRVSDFIEPIYWALVDEVVSSANVLADETRQPVQNLDKVRIGWIWVWVSDRAVAYTFSPTRGGSVAFDVLGDSPGTLTVDGYTGYNLVTGEGRRIRTGCWSHARRGVYQAREQDPMFVDELLGWMRELFAVEFEAHEAGILGTEAHLKLRQERSGPMVERIIAAAQARRHNYDERSGLAKALYYIEAQADRLRYFLQDAKVPIHNNLSERMLRVVAMLRKRSLFVGHDEAGQSYARLLSVIATCLQHDVDPERWLADVIIRSQERGSTVEELLPWVWKHGRGREAA